MALDPNIALGVKSLELPNPLARYGQLAQIQNAQNQNQLAQYQLSSAQREQESVNALNQAYAKAYDPKTGQINADALRQSLASGGFGSKLPAVEKGLLELGKLKTETQKAETDLVDARLKQARSFLETINPLDPRAPEQYIAWHQSNHADPVLGPVLKARGSTPEQSMARIQQAIQAGPQAFADLLNASKLGTEKFIELNKPVTFAQDTGTGGRVMERPGLGGAATLVPGSEFTKGKTFADINAERQANLSASRLAFEQNKFAWEKANPGFELKEAEDGSIVGVNKRTLQAFPVTVGGAAPAAAPMAGTGMPGARMPAAPVQVIPGMTSVLDQQAPAAAPAVGTPLRGKGTAPTEGERKAATLLQRLRGSQNQLSQALLDDATAAGPQAFATAVGKLSTTGANLLNTEARQRVEAAQLDILDAALTLGTGAAYTREQLEGYRQSYFPTYGDKPGNIKDKQARLKNVIEAANIAAGKAQKLVPLPPPLERLPSGGGDVDTSNPLLN
jgi:hypothetical protein